MLLKFSVIANFIYKLDLEIKGMNLRKNIVIESFFESFKAIVRKRSYILWPVIIDVLFILSFGFSAGYFISNIQEKAVALLQTGESILYSGGLIKGLLSNNETISIILSTVGLIITIYIQYCIFQGLSWRFARKFVEQKVNILRYVKKFFLINIFWFLLFIIVELLDYIGRLLGYLRGQTLGESFFFNIIIFLLFLIGYFAFISYALITKYKIIEAIKKSFSIGIRKIKSILLMYLIIAVMFLIVNLLLVLIYNVNYMLMIVVGFMTVSPAYTWARVFLNLVVGKVDKG